MARHPITLTVSPGRCGTTFLYSTFVQNYPTGCAIAHEFLHAMVARPAVNHRAYDEEAKKRILAEPIFQRTLRLWQEQAQAGPVIDFGWTTAPLVPAFREVLGDQLQVLVIHRHPIALAASLATMGTYKDFTHENYTLTPMLPGARFPHLAERWGRMSCFEKCLFRWMETTAYGLELPARVPGLRCQTLGFDEMVRSDQALQRIADFVGLPRLPQIARSLETNRLDRRNLERYPLQGEWRSYQDYADLQGLAQQLGYDMGEAHVAKMIEKYQMPPGALPFLRHVTGYWKLRSKVGMAVRALGLRKPYGDVAKMRRQFSGQL
jgi:hypothetical protein